MTARQRFYQDAGLRLKSARKAVGHSQTKFAKPLHLDQSALSRIEAGKQELGLREAFLAGLVRWVDRPKPFVNPFRVAKDADMDLGTRRLR